MKQRILFVDDEAKVLEALGRMLRGQRHEWDMEFVTGGHHALQRMAETPFDVVVSDLRMPGIDGAQLLTEIRDRHPNTVRIVLSGQCDYQTLIRSVTVAHRHLNKPCDAETLKTTVTRACLLRDLLEDKTLLALLSRLKSLPSLPSTYMEVVKELESADPSIKKVGQIVAKDMGMTAKILHLVNSAFFGARRPIANPEQAAIMLGAEALKTLVLAANVFSSFDPNQIGPLALDALWRHSVATGMLARRIATHEKCDQLTIEYACRTGIMHDVGSLVLAAHLPDAYHQIRSVATQDQILLVDAERQLLGCTHAEIGAYLLGLWGLPDPIVEALAWHHRLDEIAEQTFSLITAVHVADALTSTTGGGESARPLVTVNETYLARLGLQEKRPVWQGFLDQSVQEGAGP